MSWTDTGHKTLLPLDVRDIVAFPCVTIALTIAAFGGIGGGGVLLPIYILVLHFHMKEAVALANATILGGAIANVWFASQTRHPYADRPLIAWDLILLFEPLVIFGSVFGSFANKLLPDVILEVILVVLYSFLSYQTVSRSINVAQENGGWLSVLRNVPQTGDGTQESGSSAASGHIKPPIGSLRYTSNIHTPDISSIDGISLNISEGLPLVRCFSAESKASWHSARSYSGTGDSLPNASDLSPAPVVNVSRDAAVVKLKRKEKSVPWWKPMAMTLCFTGMAALRIGQKIVRCGSVLYWILTLSLLPWLLPFFLFARRHVLRDFQKKARLGFTFPPGDVKWTHRNTVRWPLIGSLAGVMSGMLGSSGGTIKAPLLLELGTPPTVVSGTVAQMVMFTSASSSLALSLFGSMPVHYGLALFGFGGTVTFATNWAATRTLGGKRRQVLSMLSIAAIITLSTLTMGLQASVRLVENPEAARAFGRLCE